MSKSGVKGTALQSLVEDVNRLVEEGALSRDALEARLSAEDLEVLDAKIQPALWYPLESFARFTQLLLEREGGGDVEYLRERGRRAAGRIAGSGLYNQLSEGTVGTYGERVGRMMVTVGPAMFRDTEWRHAHVKCPDTEETLGFRIAMASPVRFPPICRHAIQGFVEYMTGRAVPDVPHRFTSECLGAGRLAVEGRRLPRVSRSD